MAKTANQDSDDGAAVPSPPSTVDIAQVREVHEEATLAPGSVSTPFAQPADSAAVNSRQPRFIGDYEILSEIARGGMGVVYRAREKHSGRLLALKMMLSDSQLDSNDLNRFMLEARATSELNDPGIVTIHAWGCHEGQVFYTMDYVPGFPLSRILKRRPLNPARAVRYLLGIARAVASAHVQGIVHRDLKPGNIIIDPADKPRVLDFGLAKRHRQTQSSPDEDIVDVVPVESMPISPTSPVSSDATPQTAKGSVLGTPSYMAPEQARGLQAEVGPPADVHALGAILYEMLTGRPPFESANMMDTLIQVMEQEPTPIEKLNPRVPRTLRNVCMRCLHKNAEQRYANAQSLADDLERRWQQTTQSRRFARLTLMAGVVALLMFGVRHFLPEWNWLPGQLASNSSYLTAEGGPLLQGPAVFLADVVFVTFMLAPFAALACCFVWAGGWVWSTGVLTRRKVEESTPTKFDTDPYLQKLFAVRGEAAGKPIQSLDSEEVLHLADVEIGKTIQETQTCTISRGRQISLDRPVLVWRDANSISGSAPAFGVIVHHPDVLSLHAAESGQEGHCLVTNLAAATPLAELLERQALQPLEATFLTAKIALALQAFHDQGVRHGRLSTDWILVQGDLEPLLCPCGVPSQSKDDRQIDVKSLGKMLHGWLPPRPRRWKSKPFSVLYRVCDAAVSGAYLRPAEFAEDLKRAAEAAFVRRRERLGQFLAIGLFALPLFALGLSRLVSVGVSISETAPSAQPAGLAEILASHLFFILLPGLVFLGFVHGRGVVHYFRSGLRRTIREGFGQEIVMPTMAQLGAALVLPSIVDWASLRGTEAGLGQRAFILGLVELFSLWLMGMGAACLTVVCEFLVKSLRLRTSEEISAGGTINKVGATNLPSPQEAARTFGGRTRGPSIR